MSLRPQDLPVVPEETRRVARAAFPKGTLCLRIADALGPVYQDSQFAALFPRRRKPAEALGRLALAVVLQFVENLSDRVAEWLAGTPSREHAPRALPRFR
ncbi:MAG: hypothetical protein JOZ74_01140 [Bradyrhizobium sp.]|nr:hypothetical protein [Bradyrhizobium sp.]